MYRWSIINYCLEKFCSPIYSKEQVKIQVKMVSILGKNGFIYSELYDAMARACGFDGVADYVYRWEFTMMISERGYWVENKDDGRGSDFISQLIHHPKIHWTYSFIHEDDIVRPIPLVICEADKYRMIRELEKHYKFGGVKKIMSHSEKTQKVNVVMTCIVKHTDRFPLPIMAELSEFLDSVPEYVNKVPKPRLFPEPKPARKININHWVGA